MPPATSDAISDRRAPTARAVASITDRRARIVAAPRPSVASSRAASSSRFAICRAGFSSGIACKSRGVGGTVVTVPHATAARPASVSSAAIVAALSATSSRSSAISASVSGSENACGSSASIALRRSYRVVDFTNAAAATRNATAAFCASASVGSTRSAGTIGSPSARTAAARHCMPARSIDVQTRWPTKRQSSSAATIASDHFFNEPRGRGESGSLMSPSVTAARANALPLRPPGDRVRTRRVVRPGRCE